MYEKQKAEATNEAPLALRKAVSFSVNKIMSSGRSITKTKSISSLKNENYFLNDKLLKCDYKKINLLFLKEDELLDIEVKEVKPKKAKEKDKKRLVSYQIEELRDFDIEAGNKLYCEWSGENVDTKIETKYVYEKLIKKLEDLEANIWSLTA